MAGGKLYRYKSKRKARKSRSAYSKTGVSAPRSILPFPNIQHVKLCYNDMLTLTSTTGIIDTHIYRSNSLYDCDYTGTGHQPYTFDTYMGLYNRYEVLSTEIRITFQNRDNNYAYLAAISVQSGVSTPTSILSYMEGPNSKWALVGAENSGFGTKTLSLKVDNPKYLGLKQSDDVLQGTVGTSPDQIPYIHLAAQTTQSQSPSALDVIVDIVFNCKFSHPVKQAQS